MPRIAVALPEALLARLRGELERHGYSVVEASASADALAHAVRGGRFEEPLDHVLCGGADPWFSFALLDACDEAGIRMVALVGEESERRALRALGLHEVLSSAAPWPEVEAMLAGRRADPTPSGGAHGAGRVIAVWGPHGAPGRTTVAISVAAELAARGFSVAIADADTHGASVAPALGLLDEAPGFAAACRLAGQDALTVSELERVGERYLSGHGGFWVLTGIGRPHRWPELGADRVRAVLRQCRDWVDWVVVDVAASLENDEEIVSDLLAPRRNAATVTALREADQVLAVGAADPVGLARFLRSHVDLLECVEPERIGVVVNKLRSSVIGLNPAAQVRQTLARFAGLEPVALIPHDQVALDAALLGGKTLRDAVQRSSARTALAALVDQAVLPSGARLTPAAG